MIKIPARNFLRYSIEDLWSSLEGDFIILFEDGQEIVSNEKDVIYSAYAWEYLRHYPNTPFLKSFHVRDIIKDGRINSDTHLKLIGNVLFAVYDSYLNLVPDKIDLMDRLAKQAYEIVNRMYNDLTYRLEEYVTSIDILDFIEVADYPEIVQAIDTAPPTQDGIDHIYSVIKEKINDERIFGHNPLVKATKSGIVDVKQVLQCVGVRGFLTDIDSHVFSKPIMRNFTNGIRSLPDIAMESRSASIALAFSTDPLQQSEYFSRRQQLICQNVKHLHTGDCGSQNYLLWHVRDAQYDGNNKILDSDLKTIAGKYYLDEETNTLKVITKDDKHLIGKTIKMRSVVAGCCHPDPYGICETCFGELSLAVPKDTNIGHMACVSTTEKISQNVLSTKHHIGSSVVEGIVLKPYEKKYLHAPINGSIYFLNEGLSGKSVQLVIDSTCAMGLTDVQLVDNVERLNISRVSEFPSVDLVVTDKRGSETVSLVTNVNKRNANMTHPLLRHIKQHGWKINKDGKYVIDMEGWDYKQPVFSLPMRHFSMTDHQSEIADLLEATVKDMSYRDNEVNPTNMLIQFHDLVNRRLSINLALLDVIIYASMVVSASEGDYSLPKPWTNSGLGVMRMLLSNRSLSATAAFERQKNEFLNPNNYLQTNRPDLNFDCLVVPGEMQQLGLL